MDMILYLDLNRLSLCMQAAEPKVITESYLTNPRLHLEPDLLAGYNGMGLILTQTEAVILQPLVRTIQLPEVTLL